MDADVRRWVATCFTCKASKPQKGLTTEQRVELYERPFKALFVDTIGPFEPKSDGCSYIFHAE